jgi:hypothetical protein
MTKIAWMRATMVAAALLAGVTAASAQEQSKLPDWSGQWMRGPGMGTGWDGTKDQGFGQQAPLTAEYRAKFEAFLADKAAGGIGGDMTAICYPHGMPRMMIAIYPIEFIITPKVTYILTDYTTHRRVYTDGRDWPKEILPSYNGYSIGKWIDQDGDGRYDLLEVETRGFKGPRTYEGSGMPLHEDNATVIRERIAFDKSNAILLRIETTITDSSLTRPWTVSRVYRREAKPFWDFVDCAENNPHILVGRDYYMISADGFLMPTKKGQATPDLRYFNNAPTAPAR